MSNSVWVTGAGGFLGSAACRRLFESGASVRPVLRSPDQSTDPTDDAVVRALPAGLEPLFLDLEAGAEVLEEVAEPPAALVHFAARIPSGPDPEEATSVAAANRAIDDAVFRFAAGCGAAVVFASSGSVYGPGEGGAFEEAGPTDPRIPYAVAKLESEQRGAEVLGGRGLPFAALRVSAPYGPGQRTNTVAHLFMKRALAGEDISFHGTGERQQDFVYVTDVADAVVCCVDRRAAGVFNIASGVSTSTRELAEAVVGVVGGASLVGPSGTPDAEENRQMSYSIAAAAGIGWAPRTSLREGLGIWRDAIQAAAT